MPTQWGTCHFVSRRAAVSYYRPYGETAADVDRKLAAGEIRIGPPGELKPGDRLRVIDSGRRYAIETRDAGDPRRDVI